MAELDRDKLHAYFSAKAKTGQTVTVKDVAAHFGVEEGAANKAMSILTGNCALVEKNKGEFDYSRVPALSTVEFASAASQGKSNTAYVEGLWKKMGQLKKNNDTMRAKLEAAQARIAELEGKPLQVDSAPISVTSSTSTGSPSTSYRRARSALAIA